MLLGGIEEKEERESGYLFPNDFIIFDEAHTIEQVASRQIGIAVSQYGLRATVQRLYNARTRKGLFTVTRDAPGVTLAAELVDDDRQIFRCDRDALRFSQRPRSSCARIGPRSRHDQSATDRAAGANRRGRETERRRISQSRAQELGRRMRDARLGIVTFLEQSAEGHVYWVERTGKTAQFLSLNAAPIDTAPVLRRMLFRDDCSCVMTSATLAVGRADLAYFRERIGAGGVEPVQLGSPFDFTGQMKLFVVQKMPDPRDGAYHEALAKWIAHFVEETDGRAFVLFTSYRGMHSLAQEMEGFFATSK